MANDRFFLNALVRKNRRLPAPTPGQWSSDAPKADFLSHLAADILVDGQVLDPHAISSVPSAYARPLQFVHAFTVKDHPLHQALVRQWRGLLAVFALSDYLGLSVSAVPFEVPQRPSPDDVDYNLSLILRNQMPRPGADWERFWLLYCDGALLGATSPWTVAYTAADYTCPPTVPWRTGDGLLGDPIEHYRKVGGAHVELTLLYHWADGVLQERWGFERRLDEMAAALRRELTALHKELEKYRESHLSPGAAGMARIDQWPYRAFLRPLTLQGEQGPQSTLMLAASHGEPTLLLPREGLLPTRRVYQSVLVQDVDLGRIPAEGAAGWSTRAGRTVPVPYLIPEEVFLPRRLCELTVSERALSRGGSDFALPVTPALLRYFPLEELLAKPDLLSISATKTDIHVRLRLPVFGEAPLSVERKYRRGVDTFKIGTPVMALWPDFYSPDFAGNLALYHGDAPDVSVRPLLSDGRTLDTSREGPGQRVWTHSAPLAGFAVYHKDQPVGVVLRESLPAPERPRADREWVVSVDFGTSNTHVLCDDGHGPPQPLQLQGRTVCLTLAREEFNEALRYFYPTEAPKLPLVTLLVENPATALGERTGVRYAPVFTFYPDLLISGNSVKNVKWGQQGGGTESEAPLREYLLGLVRYIAAEARARGVGGVQLRWSYPTSLPEGARGAMAAFWHSVNLFTSAVRVEPAQSASESEAACSYLSQPRLDILPVASGALSIIVDVGGGSSDIGFWTQGGLLEQVSFYLAANHLTEAFVGLEGLAQTLFRICSGQIESTYEAVRPAFSQRPAIMFNAIVSQARGWGSDNPQEHPVVRELFGGTLAPHGGPPWVWARGLSYLLFTGLSYYCGLHARRLLRGALREDGQHERRFFLYFGGRGSSLLSWLSRSEGLLSEVLQAAFREGLFADRLLDGILSRERARIEVMGPAIQYRDKAPPKEEVVGGLLCQPTVLPEKGPDGQDKPRSGRTPEGPKQEVLVGERGWSDGAREVRWDEDMNLARLRSLRPQRTDKPGDKGAERAQERYIDHFLSRVVSGEALGNPAAFKGMNLDLREEALKVDPDRVQHRLRQGGILQPVFVYELEMLLQGYLEWVARAPAGKAR